MKTPSVRRRGLFVALQRRGGRDLAKQPRSCCTGRVASLRYRRRGPSSTLGLPLAATRIRAMSELTPEETKVTAWLASRKEAMVALLREMVDTDSGSYDKAGVDRAGQVLARFHEANGLVVEIVPDARYGDAVKARLPNPAANDQRPVLLLGHRDTVFPAGRADAPALHRQGRPRLWTGRRRHEGGAGDRGLRRRRLRRMRRALRPAPDADDERRGDRLAVFPADHRGGGAGGALRLQCRAEPAAGRDGVHPRPQAVDHQRPQGRRLHARRIHRQGRPFRRELRQGRLGHCRSRPQDPEAPGPHRSGAWRHRQCRADRRRPDGQHHRAPCLVRDRPALCHRRPARRAGRGDPRHRRDAGGAGHDRRAHDQGRVPAAGTDAGSGRSVRGLSRGRQDLRHRGQRRIHRRLRRFRASPRRRAARPCAASAPSAASPIRPTSSSRSRASSRPRRRWRSR